jgi:4-amino-4-deoxy-L-arabinose transferase-like glycosyltransferase
MRSQNTSRWQFVFSCSVLLLAAAVRLWLIGRMPTGLYTDEAYHLLRAQEILRGQALPVFITGNNGYEPLFVYLTAGVLPILGPVPWAGRLVAAWLGLISVAAAIRVGKEFFPGRFAGALAGLTLATLLWSLTFSRFGSQPIIAATASAAALAAFWHGVRTRSKWAFALAGACIGLGLDGYVAFRFFPLIMIVAILALLITRREAWRHWLSGTAITVAVAALLFAPLALFFIQNPQWFLLRFGQTTSKMLGTGDRLAALVANGLKVIGGLFVEGDHNWRHNLAGRPVLDVVQAVFFVAGLAAAVRQWRRPEIWTLLAWLVIGLSPSVITAEAPHFGRTTLAMPAVALMVGLGIDALWRVGKRRLIRGLITLAFVASGLLAVRDFFGRWASAPQLYEAFSTNQVQLARAIEKIVPPGANLYVTPLPLSQVATRHIYWSLEYLLGAQPFSRRITFDGQTCQMFPPPSAEAIYLVYDEPAAWARLNQIYPTVKRIGGLPHLQAGYIPAGQAARWPIEQPRLIRFGEFVTMLGDTVTPASPLPGQALQFTVIWQANQATPADYKIFLHLAGAPQADGSAIYAQLDPQPCGEAYPTWQWQPGDTLLVTYALALPDNLPTGSYTLTVGWYDEAAGLRLPVTDETQQPLGDAFTLAHFQIGESASTSK